MRQIGTLKELRLAERFAAFLVTEGIAAHAEEDGSESAVWVRDENQLDRSKQLLADFRLNPDDARYDDVERTAAAIRSEQVRQREAARKNVVEMRGKWGKPGAATAKRAPLVFVLIGLSVLASLWTNFGNKPKETDQLTFLSTANLQDIKPMDFAGPFVDIKAGQVWRLLTPIFVHGGVFHLVMNMYWVYQFGAQIEHYKGTAIFGLLVVAIALVSNIAQAVIDNPNFIGMSGVAFGLFGYVWVKSAYDPGSRLFVSRGTAIFFLVFAFICLFGYFGPIANTAHFAGLGAGAILAYAPLLLGRR